MGKPRRASRTGDATRREAGSLSEFPDRVR
jgi:hypothetical protein